MVGRITSECPVEVDWKATLEASRANHRRVINAMADALQSWLVANEAPRNSKERRKLLRIAREKTEFALN